MNKTKIKIEKQSVHGVIEEKIEAFIKSHSIFWRMFTGRNGSRRVKSGTITLIGIAES